MYMFSSDHYPSVEGNAQTHCIHTDESAANNNKLLLKIINAGLSHPARVPLLAFLIPHYLQCLIRWATAARGFSTANLIDTNGKKHSSSRKGIGVCHERRVMQWKDSQWRTGVTLQEPLQEKQLKVNGSKSNSFSWHACRLACLSYLKITFSLWISFGFLFGLCVIVATYWI